MPNTMQLCAAAALHACAAACDQVFACLQGRARNLPLHTMQGQPARARQPHTLQPAATQNLDMLSWASRKLP